MHNSNGLTFYVSNAAALVNAVTSPACLSGARSTIVASSGEPRLAPNNSFTETLTTICKRDLGGSQLRAIYRFLVALGLQKTRELQSVTVLS